MTTPDQYRREGAEAMREVIASMFTHPEAKLVADRIRETPLPAAASAPDAVARLVEAAIAEYLLEPPFQTELERMGRKATARGMMVRLGIYEEFKEALAAMENEQCQVSIELATGATINGPHGSGANAPAAGDNSHPDAVARRAKRKAVKDPNASPTVAGNVRCMDCRCDGYGCPGMPRGYEQRLMENW